MSEQIFKWKNLLNESFLKKDDDDINPILLFDSLNLFTRHYTANPAISSLGEHVGGIIGFLNSLKMIINDINPSKVILIWEGGGSQWRRNLFPDYKAKRKPQSLNRYHETAQNDLHNTIKNRNYQITNLIKILENLPIIQIYVQDCEADDVIGFLCKNKYINEHKVIISSDKDYYQLLDDKTVIYTPGRKIYLQKQHILDEFKILPSNFALAKAINGDKSDCIPGVKGVGFKTLAKNFPELKTDENLTLDKFFNLNINLLNKIKYKQKSLNEINNSHDLIKRNFKLINLENNILSYKQIESINYIINNHENKKDKFQLIKKFETSVDMVPQNAYGKYETAENLIDLLINSNEN